MIKLSEDENAHLGEGRSSVWACCEIVQDKSTV